MYLALVHEETGLGWWNHHPGYLGHGGFYPKMKREIIDCVSQVRHLAPMLLAPDAPVGPPRTRRALTLVGERASLG